MNFFIKHKIVAIINHIYVTVFLNLRWKMIKIEMISILNRVSKYLMFV